uniref:Uncharacterized protein n=1 Tax=Rhizophora mucronata TaxID=61149 RepID=A0A2P2KRJ8_RHIMU
MVLQCFENQTRPACRTYKIGNRTLIQFDSIYKFKKLTIKRRN